MKLLFLTEFYPQNERLVYTGGVEVRTYNIASLAKADYQVQIISSSSSQVPATFLSIFSRVFYIISAFFKALFTPFDLIEASNYVTYLPAYLAAGIKGKPAVAWIPDVLGKDWLQFGFFVGIFGWLIETISLKLPFNQFIALSHTTKTKLLKRGIHPNKILVAYGGIQPQEFKPKMTKSKPDTIITVARLVKTKRVTDLVTAFMLLKSQFPQLQLQIVGIGPEKPNLLTQVSQLGLKASVTFHASLSRQELVQHLAKAKLFCLPSIVEGFGLVTVEALAAGTPAVIADIATNREITHRGRGVLFFQPQNTDDLAKQLTTLLKNPKLYTQKQQEGLALSKNYSWEKIYSQTKKAYENCLAR